MAIRDITNDLEVEVVHLAAITTNTTTLTDSVDMAHFDSGYMFTLASYTYTDGTYVLTLQDSPDDSVWTDVPAAGLIDPAGAGSLTLSAVNAPGDLLGRIGAFSTDRYLRAKIVSTATTSGAFVTINATKMPEQKPA